MHPATAPRDPDSGRAPADSLATASDPTPSAGDDPAATSRQRPPRRRRSLLRRVVRLATGTFAAFLGLLASSVLLVSCVIAPPPVASVSGDDRLDRLEGPWPGLRGTVTIRWDAHLVPSIEADDDHDAAFALGLVHTHLRGNQMELFRRVSQGRLAEMLGTFVAEVDVAIRAIDLGRATPEMEAALPDDTRAWITAYVAGINAYRARGGPSSADVSALGLTDTEPWTVQDVLTLGRLLSVDVNWGRWLALIPLRDETGYDDFAARLWEFADAGQPSFGAGEPHDLRALTDIGRTGSNAFVVSGDRSVSGGALVASDPHLGLPQPNIWCAVGYRTPDRSVVGISIAGLPFVLVGRNETIAWTGTNMQSSSTVLYRLGEDWSPTGVRTEPIGVRWWFDRQSTIRESAYGPVISDAKLLKRLGEGDIAMRWRGHLPSDEGTAFFRASSADDWESFRAAFRPYAAGGQNILYGDVDGNIGQLMAVEAIPAAAAAARLGPVDADDPTFAWGPGIPSDRLPAAYNPEPGFLVSANNVPVRMEPALVAQGNSNDRVERLTDLLASAGTLSLDDLAVFQRDVHSASSQRAARAIVARLGTAAMDDATVTFAEALDGWDGDYAIESTGAVVYQAALDTLIDLLYADRYGDRIRRTMRSAGYVHDFVAEDVASIDPAELLGAIAAVAADHDHALTWGDWHRVRLAHPIGNVPIVGRSYVFDDIPSAGSTSTVYKSAHAVSAERHNVTFGANARLLCDLGTLDDNRVVILGGQDGWLGSDRLLDQVAMWQDGRMIPLPLSAAGQRERAVTTLRLSPTTR